MIWLGVDGGGSKTAFALIDDTGRLLAAATGPGSYHLADGLDHVAEVLRAGTVAVCNDAGIVAADIDHAYVGLPGHGETTADLAAIEALPAVALGHARYGCGNDMVCAWAGSLAGADGVNVVAGTGSIAYGERDGRGARAGGWGEVFGDEGSAYWIAVQGLRLAARMSDGRSPRGPLLDVLLEHLGLTAELDLVDVVLTRWRGDRPRIAALARQVGVAVERGDPAAAGVFVAAGRELADLVTATRRGLDWPDATPMPVSWSGGVFDAVLVRETFRDALERSPLPHDVRRPMLTPVLGAAVHAARLAGHPLAPEALARLRGPAARTTAAGTGSVADGAG